MRLSSLFIPLYAGCVVLLGATTTHGLTLPTDWIVQTAIVQNVLDAQLTFPCIWPFCNTTPPPFWEKAIELGHRVRQSAEAELKKLLNNANITQEVLDKIAVFKTSISDVVGNTTQFTNDILHAIEERNITLDTLSDELALAFNASQQAIADAFPSPEKAASHDKRVEMVNKTMDIVGFKIVEILTKIDVDGNKTRELLAKIRPPLQTAIVTCGDLVEQHPEIVGFLLFLAVGFVAEIVITAWLLRPLLSLFGFGPYGPIKGSVAAWLQSRLFGPYIPKGSWFSMLQSVGQTVGRIIGCCGRRK